MDIAVLMSVYISEKDIYLDRALKSIWSDQTLRPQEIILVEDGPLTPNLYRVIENWKSILGKNLIIIKNETNIGLTKSLNKGIRATNRQFIARMDSDDISHPDRFKKQIEYLLAHPDISVLGGSIQEFNDENECISIRNYPSSHKDVLKYIYKASPLAHPAVMLRRSIFDGNLHYNEEYRTSQDIALWFDVICKGYHIANINDIVLYFRRDDDIFKRRGKEKARNEFKIYMSGIRRVYGLFTWRYIFPIMRYLFRLIPTPLLKSIYGSKLRKLILNR